MSSDSGAKEDNLRLKREVNALLCAVDNDIARTGDVVKAIDKFFAYLLIQEQKTLVRLKEENIRLKRESVYNP